MGYLYGDFFPVSITLLSSLFFLCRTDSLNGVLLKVLAMNKW